MKKRENNIHELAYDRRVETLYKALRSTLSERGGGIAPASLLGVLDFLKDDIKSLIKYWAIDF